VARPVFGASPSGTLESVGSKYNPEVALMRREVDLRRQLGGIQTALTKCNRKAAVKLRLREVDAKKQLTQVARAVRDIQSVNGAGKGEEEAGVGLVVAGIAEGTEAVTEGAVGSAGSGGVAGVEGVVGVDGLETVEGESAVPCVVDRGSALLAKLLAHGRPPGTVEETWERIILAEQLRHSLQQQYGDSLDAPPSPSSSPSLSPSLAGSGEVSLSQQYVQYINSNFATVAKSVASVVKVD
jgi:hypothetical protein